jgi:hypothetical protein
MYFIDQIKLYAFFRATDKLATVSCRQPGAARLRHGQAVILVSNMGVIIKPFITSLLFVAYCSTSFAESGFDSSQCRYEGKIYSLGTSWSPDGCNKCDCIRKADGANAVAICTTIACSKSEVVQTKRDCSKGKLAMGGKEYAVDCDGAIAAISEADGENKGREIKQHDTDSAPASKGGDLK